MSKQYREDLNGATLRCEICDFHPKIGTRNYAAVYNAAPDQLPGNMPRMKVQGTPTRMTMHKGRALCNVCLANEKEALTDAKYAATLSVRSEETLAKYQTGDYLTEIDNQLVVVKTYKPSHPKIRKVVDEPRTCSILEGYTKQEQADWIEEYSKSLAS